MKAFTASEAKQSFASVMDAANREPVVIRRQKRDIAMVVSMQEYERLANLNVAEFQRFCDSLGSAAAHAGMTEAKLAALLADETA